MIDRDDIIRMAREAGFIIDEDSRQHQPNCIVAPAPLIDEHLKRFAALIAAVEQKKWAEQTMIEINEAKLDEREACAKLCYELPWRDMTCIPSNLAFSAAIRARSNK